jgi:hypothetical protein
MRIPPSPIVREFLNHGTRDYRGNEFTVNQSCGQRRELCEIARKGNEQGREDAWNRLFQAWGKWWAFRDLNPGPADYETVRAGL